VIRALTLWFGRDKTRGEGGVGDFHIETQGTSQDIPMATVNRPESRELPKYSARAESTHVSSLPDIDYQEQKFGFAGQRNYDDSLRREETKGGHSRVSSHGEVWGDSKR